MAWEENTRLWCRGVVGREHKLKEVNWPYENSMIGWIVDKCEICGKQLNLRKANERRPTTQNRTEETNRSTEEDTGNKVF